MKFKLVKCYDEDGVEYTVTEWVYDDDGRLQSDSRTKTNDWSFGKRFAATAFLSLLQLIAFLTFLATIFLAGATLEDNAVGGAIRILSSLVIYVFVTGRISEHVGWIWDVNQDLDFWRKVRIIQERENKKEESDA